MNLHEEMSGFIPWYVNGTLADEERSRLEAHCAECVRCREELETEQLIHRGMAQQPAVEYMPASSLKKLQVMIEGGVPTSRAARPARRLARPSLMAASVAALAVAVSLLAADRLMVARNLSEPKFYVTTNALPRNPDVVIRAVFAPALTVEQLNRLLDEAQLRIVSGPTEAGVYSLAATSKRPVTDSLTMLRQRHDVRFAESTQVNAESPPTP